MNKQQKDYLKNKLSALYKAKLEACAKDMPLEDSKEIEDIFARAIEKTGLVLCPKNIRDNYWGHTRLVDIAKHFTKANGPLVQHADRYRKLEAELKIIYNDAIDMIELGDNADAISLLKDFTARFNAL